MKNKKLHLDKVSFQFFLNGEFILTEVEFEAYIIINLVFIYFFKMTSKFFIKTNFYTYLLYNLSNTISFSLSSELMEQLLFRNDLLSLIDGFCIDSYSFSSSYSFNYANYYLITIEFYQIFLFLNLYLKLFLFFEEYLKTFPLILRLILIRISFRCKCA